MENQNLYIPKSKTAEWEEYQLKKRWFRRLDPKDAGKLHRVGIMIETAGRPPRQTFKGFRFVYIDVLRVSKVIADVYIRDEEKPIRFKIITEKILIERN